MCTEQPWTGGAAFVVFLAAVIDRMSYKYRLPRTYRVTLLNAGHLGQTFALTATALGLGPAQTGAFYDVLVARRCGLDDTGTTPIYTLLAGHPASAPDAEYAPPPARLATFGFPTTMT
jgi:SagB-type dehydrogenase family enzyme